MTIDGKEDTTGIGGLVPVEKKDYGAQDEKIAAMRRWCDVQKITHTPTIFINEHELPGEYSVEELKEVLA